MSLLSMSSPGLFTVSIDLELAWGICDIPLTAADREALAKEREIVGRILDLFQRYDMRATWAIVAHLLLQNCPHVSGKLHPDFPRPVTRARNREWFFQVSPDPSDQLWYGRDVVDIVRRAKPVQEIGSHSFCHLPFSEELTDSAAIRADLHRARSIHEQNALPFEVFVFPRNTVGFLRELSEAGIRAYRGKSARWYHSIPVAAVQRALNLAYFLLGVPPRTVTATVDEFGSVNVPDSMLLLGRGGIRRCVSAETLSSMASAGLERAARSGETFHLWFHVSNFAYRTDGQFSVLENILGHAGRLREDGRLEVRTVGEYWSRPASQP